MKVAIHRNVVTDNIEFDDVESVDWRNHILVLKRADGKGFAIPYENIYHVTLSGAEEPVGGKCTFDKLDG